MQRWFLRLAGGIVVAAALVIGLAWLTLRASLPDIEGELTLDGLSAGVTIERDGEGIPTITASTRGDLAFATGFAHGQDRFFQMDLIRRHSAGELSELFGGLTIDADKRFRFHRFRSRAQAGLAKLPESEAALVERYAEGVNAGVASLSAKPFEYYLLRVEPEPWLPEDSVLVVFTMFINLNDERATGDVQRGLAHRLLPQDLYAWMYPQGTPWDAPLMGEARGVAPVPAADVVSIRDIPDTAPPSQERGKRMLNGSNNWAVSGALTSTGRAIVSNDMHLGLQAPNIYYQARLVVDGDRPRDVTGVTLPGTPFVVAGSNTKVAWGYTNSYGDWSDAVILRPGAEPGTYKTPTGDVAFAEHRERINVKGADPVDVTIRETIWGPVDEGADYPAGEIAVSWIAHESDAINLQIIDLENADSVFAALDIANGMGIPPQNFVTGDSVGNIAWTITGKIPLRSDFDPLRPADWSESAGWTGWVDAKHYPRIVNPASGRIWSANARVADGEALDVIGDSGYEFGARALQIRDALFEQDTFAPTDMLAIQIDDRALFLTRWRDLLLDVLDAETTAGDERLAEYRRLVEDWIPRAVPESVGYRLVRAFRLEVQARVFHALMTPVREEYVDEVKLRISNQFEASLWSLVTERPEHFLPADYDSWQEFMVEAVRENIRYFDDNYDGPLADRSWGERNTALIEHPLSRAVPMLAKYLDMPREPLAGDADLPKAQTPNFGASQHFSVSPGDEANSLMHMPTGQSGHPLSDFYRRGHDDWVHGRSSPFLPGETRHKLTLLPATD
ncbi:MAG: penicillin acylase family protein [Gammaproteobacteria bacterium]|nr:penicillin acylase family protein [Gammaproteobacteria bacterium]MDH3750541.1 penicillin acylase family protein [Gammaproteobacteria bacterium]